MKCIDKHFLPFDSVLKMVLDFEWIDQALDFYLSKTIWSQVDRIVVCLLWRKGFEMRPMCQYHSLYTIYLTALNLGLFWLALGFIALNLESYETFRICKENNFQIDVNLKTNQRELSRISYF